MLVGKTDARDEMILEVDIACGRHCMHKNSCALVYQVDILFANRTDPLSSTSVMMELT